MLRVGDAFRQADVRAIYLVHGTFVGADALGLIREVARVSHAAAEPLRRLEKYASDAITGDAGNFTPQYAAEFERSLGQDAGTQIPVRLFHWSSENHHIGRADGAVRLIHELAEQEHLAGGRVLLWGHSHGGNVFALLTNLLANSRRINARFFRACRSYYRWPLWGRVDIPIWRAVRRMLRKSDHPLKQTALDLVTLGTPVRYGWDEDGMDQLLHFINHRPCPGMPVHRAAPPTSLDDVLTAAGGDYIQQLGIAGSNITPPLWAWRAWLAEIRLSRLLQAGVSGKDLLAHLKLGVRAHDTGENLLVDYGPAEGHIGQHLAGHAVYTRQGWLLFHAEQVAQRFYGWNEAEPLRSGEAAI
jgi:hypothetical protein